MVECTVSIKFLTTVVQVVKGCATNASIGMYSHRASVATIKEAHIGCGGQVAKGLTGTGTPGRYGIRGGGHTTQSTMMHWDDQKREIQAIA
jgi:hypothetical protein